MLPPSQFPLYKPPIASPTFPCSVRVLFYPPTSASCVRASSLHKTKGLPSC